MQRGLSPARRAAVTSERWRARSPCRSRSANCKHSTRDGRPQVTTTLTHPRPAPPSSNGHGPASLFGGRRVNRTRIVAGVLLVALCTLGTVTLRSNADSTTSVLVASRTIAPGDVISASDLRAAQLYEGAGADAIAADRS